MTPRPRRELPVSSSGSAGAIAAVPAGVRTLRAAIYARVSHDLKDTGRSVAQQETEGRAHVAREGWNLVGVWVDNSKGASKYSRGVREEWQALLELIAAGEIDVLVVWEPSRLTRDRLVWATLAHHCEERDVKIAASGRVYDLADPDDAFQLDLYFALGIREVGITRKRVMRDKSHEAKAGKPHGRLLFGYYRLYSPTNGALLRQVKDDRRRINLWAVNAALFIAVAALPELWPTPLGRFAMGWRPLDPRLQDLLDADSRRQPPWWALDPAIRPDRSLLWFTRERVVHMLLRRSLEGDKEFVLARELGFAGILTGTNSQFTTSSIRTLVTNPSYAGLRSHHDSLFEAVWPAYISVEDHLALVAKFAKRAQGRPNRDHSLKYLLSGLLSCAVCGGTTSVQGEDGDEGAEGAKKTRPHQHYICVGRGRLPGRRACTARPRRPTELYIIELVLEWLSSPEAADALLADERSASNLRALMERRGALQRRLDELYDTAGRTGMSDRLAAATERNLTELIAEVDADIDATQRYPVLRGLVKPDRTDVEAAWERLDLFRKREVIKTLFVRLEMKKVGRGRKGVPIEETIDVTWREFALVS
ncbi:recombinase family protein [Actinomadura sp. WMMA1423]|uniref:recombinase family protein n=1 Tax=Actinomadura sp. WMMA1423 TaxID=2591108 RepID=UPI0011464948|nr:recombinase family protein [Actinomadura sp. WMMA1423]